MEIWLTNN